MVFFTRGAGGPDAVGGLWPTTVVARCWNRSGATLVKGDVVQLALGAAQVSTEIASNDSNSYLPGYSNDTVWNTVIAPQTNAITSPRPGTITGGLFGVCVSDSVADNSAAEIQFFGIVQAYIKDAASGDGAVPGQVLSPTTSNNFSCHVTSNRVISAVYLDSADATLTNRALKRVFLSNGLGLSISPDVTFT